MDKNFKILEKLHLLLAKELTDKITRYAAYVRTYKDF